MIKVNLAARLRSGNYGASGHAGTMTLKGLTATNLLGRLSDFKGLPFQKALVPLAIAIAANYGVETYEDSQLKKLDAELDAVNSEKPKLQSEAGKMKSYEDLKKTMEDDEFVIRTKLETIQKLVKGRGDMGHMLQDLAKLTPPGVWLTEFSFNGTEPVISGGASNFQLVGPYLKNLNENPFFKDIIFKDSQNTKDDRGRPLTKFSFGMADKK